MRIDEMIKVMQHYRDGGEVEQLGRIADCTWKPFNSYFNFSEYFYRIKEKPKTKTVYEIMFKNTIGNWYVGDKLLTEAELIDCKDDEVFTKYQKTGRQWEVPND